MVQSKNKKFKSCVHLNARPPVPEGVLRGCLLGNRLLGQDCVLLFSSSVSPEGERYHDWLQRGAWSPASSLGRRVIIPAVVCLFSSE